MWAAAAAAQSSASAQTTEDTAAVSSHGIDFNSGKQQAAAQLTASPAQAADANVTTAAGASQTQAPERKQETQGQLPAAFADLFPEQSIIPGTSYSVCYSIGSSCPTSAVFACKDLTTEQHDLVSAARVAPAHSLTLGTPQQTAAAPFTAPTCRSVLWPPHAEHQYG